MTKNPRATSRTVVELVIFGAAEVFTAAPGTGGGTGGGVAVHDGRIVAVGDISGFEGLRTIDAERGVVAPGFVDAHTHVVFGGSRVAEYAATVSGRAVPDGAPTGIEGTVVQTRETAPAQLIAQAGARIAEMVQAGTTTIEAKTGYGLTVAAEQMLLDVHRELAARGPARIVTTYTGGHAFGPERKTAADRDAWVLEVAGQARAIGPAADTDHAGLAQFNDVYCDEGYFDLAQTGTILRAGLEAGLRPRLHLDAYSHTGAAAIAADLGAASADHLNHTTDPELRRLAAAEVTGVYLPALEYAVDHPRPLDPRRIRDAGMNLALATDICPGCWTVSMQTVIQMACRTGGLTPAEAITAATHGSAVSLGLASEIGSIEVGKRADLVILDLPSHEDLAYRMGRNHARIVIAGGAVVSQRSFDPAKPLAFRG